ncbi:MAG TPA: hypothetical protein VHR44_15905 [Beijerinckiaceae bacterium]|nr:hypothetical protein [Beijerinckiaceae bacterium]
MTQFELSLSPLLPVALIIALAIAAALVVALAIYARRPGATLRALGFALVLFALLDPSLVRQDREPLKDVVAVVLDQSGSQTIGERREQTERARAELEKSLGALGNVETRLIETNRNDAENDGTRLFSALNAGLADVPPERVGGAILVTDGIVHDIPTNADALGFRAPLHALITGHEGERDRRIDVLEAPRFGIVGKDQTIEVRVLDTARQKAPVRLKVSRDGAEIASIQAQPDERIDVPVRIEHGGPNVVEIEVEALPDELTAINNKAVLTIDGVRDKLKVLLVSGEPHAGERTWRNLLKSDANVELVHFTILRPPEKQDGTPINELSLIAFPTSDLFGRRINDFDLIIFDRYSNQSILPSVYFENIVRYVRDGGAILMAVGPDFSRAQGLYYSPLGKISPARPDGSLTERPFRADVTEDGRKHPVTRGLPGAANEKPQWGEWFRQVNTTLSRGTDVLSGAQDKPLLVLSREQKGRVALLLSDQMWLWARGYDGGGPYLDLLRRLAHWLMKEPDLEEEALRASVHGHELAIERQSLKDAVPPVTVTTPSGAQQQVTLNASEPGLWRASMDVKELGLYRLSDGEQSVLANAGPENPREFQEVISTPEKLRGLTEAAGGTVRRIAADAQGAIAMPRVVAMRDSPVYGGSDYIGIKRNSASVVKGIGIVPLAIGFAGMLVLIASIVAGWAWEGRRRRWRRAG